MKKSDLKATLGAVCANEELVKRTMRRIEERRFSERACEHRGGMSVLSFGTRLAAAACAFALVIGVGVLAMKNGLFSEDNAEDYTPHRAAETDDLQTISDTSTKGNYDDVFKLLQSESKNIDGEWAIFSGTANAFYFAEGENEEGKRRCVISVSVEKLGESSGLLLSKGDELIAEVYFDLDDEVQNFIDSLSSEVSVLIEKNGMDNDQYWTVKKIIY